MNLFFLSTDPREIAHWQVDKHATKMIVESAQMLSTAHRLIDGSPVQADKKVHYLLPGETINNQPHLYKVAHAHHPSTIWTMETSANYQFHAVFFWEMLREYARRYPDGYHSCRSIANRLAFTPDRITQGIRTTMPQAMPDHYKVEDSIEAYRRYYAGAKWRFAKWKHGEIPPWFFSKMEEVWYDEQFEERCAQVQAAGQRNTLPMDKRVYDVARELCVQRLQTAA